MCSVPVHSERAGESEERVKEITRDIKQLDTAKRNLTCSITTLNHLQMLVEGTHKLQALQARREYGEVASLLQGVLEVMQHLHRYKHIPQVAELARQVEQIRSGLEKQILEDFGRAFHGPASRQPTPTRALAEACLVVNQLDPRVRCVCVYLPVMIYWEWVRLVGSCLLVSSVCVCVCVCVCVHVCVCVCVFT
ncbi:Vacuolar protein sorting-associated protein 53 [Chionoecetes opilio]|uniref:Vacuolar protein sorting-associated protein 53 n=1 Tax=Chionoecetes opilio TaxID=41210 RepID=A0A8J5CJG8_CHIOP|nr:Vacuolar protein sorting-associated protein 53 [Chionoecetes opilio]